MHQTTGAPALDVLLIVEQIFTILGHLSKRDKD